MRVGVSLVLLVATGCGGEATLQPGVLTAPNRHDPPATDVARVVLGFAQAQVGHPYCWGGTGPSCFDCSGLAMTAWLRVGVRVPRTADAIAETLPEVSPADVRPGDILWWPGHVGLYAGNGWAIEALNARSGVVERRAATPQRVFRPRGVL
jgi:cell wall-associated NlpC family hydrolase